MPTRDDCAMNSALCPWVERVERCPIAAKCNVSAISSLTQVKRDRWSVFRKPSAGAISRVRSCGEIVDRFSQNHTAGPTFKRLQFRKAADPGRDARELHRLAAIRAARCICCSVHGFVSRQRAIGSSWNGSKNYFWNAVNVQEF